ncbi:hypothetical protein N9O57_01635 [bacterium]|nr:hypothetical protein [bacterium]
MSEYSVGKEILSLCSKCSLSLAHIIASMKEGKVDKVVCSTCKSTHKHKDPNAPKKKKKVGTRKRKAAINYEDLWKETLEKASELLPYSIRFNFSAGDCLSHKTFGDGFVEKCLDNNKIYVLFRSGHKTLIHNK